MKTVKTGFLALLAAVALLFAGATMVQAQEEADGVGDVLIYPLYLADSAAFTEFTLVNTANVTQPVHIQIRSQGDSRDQLDFCIDLTTNDVYKAKISASGNGAILETLNNVDILDSNEDKRTYNGHPLNKAEELYGLIRNDLSTCSYGTQKGYIVAYTVSDCADSDNITSGNAIMGNTRIIETATSKIMALNAIAIEANETASDPFIDAQAKLCKDELYMLWEFEKTAAVLTVPSLDGTNATNDSLCEELVGLDADGILSNDLCGCGFIEGMNTNTVMYNLDEKKISQQSPYYYPANEVSIVNFADAGTNTDSTNFFINGGPEYWGFNFTNAPLTEGWIRWKTPKGTSASALCNVVGTYFISTNNSLAWMPCQYQECE